MVVDYLIVKECNFEMIQWHSRYKSLVVVHPTVSLPSMFWNVSIEYLIEIDWNRIFDMVVV